MNHIEITEKIIHMVTIVNQKAKIPMDYGTGHLLYQAEIHMIDTINNHKNINASEIANILGITNGAVNQITTKLIDKGLIIKYNVQNNKKEVYYALTPNGEIANKTHLLNHKKIYEEIKIQLETLSPSFSEDICIFLDRLIFNLMNNLICKENK